MKTAFKSVFAINSRKSFKAYMQRNLNLLKEISNQRLITQGTALHGHLIKKGISSEKYVAVKLLVMYLKCRKYGEINQMLKEFNGFNLVVYNCLIAANVEWGNLNEARRLFEEMPQRGEVTRTALVSGLLRYGRVDEALWYFERNPFRDVFSWTAMISGLVQNGLGLQGMKLFLRMLDSGVMPNNVTFTTFFKACADSADFGLGMSALALVVKVGFDESLPVCNSLITFSLKVGEINLARRIFDGMKERDVVSWTAILDAYVEMDSLEEARRIFDEMPERNEISWSAMIARYSQNGYAEDAVNLFHEMVQSGFKPNKSCFSCAISALASLEALQAGRNIHGHVIKIGIETDVFISSSLVDLYCKCKETGDGRRVFDLTKVKNVACWNSMVAGYSLNCQLEEARKLFDLIPCKNNVSWNCLIVGYLENEQFDKVTDLFNEMLLSGETPNKSTFSSVLRACSSLASLERGKVLHGKIVKHGFQYDIYVGTALISMYSKSGDIECSKQVFSRMPRKNEVSWAAMIQAFAENGFAEESLALFDEFEHSSSFAPNELILLAVLFSCSHCGLVDKGLHYFNSMEKIYGIKPTGRHYTCVVDMLSRSGCLSEAEKFITGMSCEHEVNAWVALLNGSRIYRDKIVAEKAAKKFSKMVEEKSEVYVMLSNVYASAGRWFDVLNTRKLMIEKGLYKGGGCSWIEERNHIHVFYCQDGTHIGSTEIYGVLQLLKSEM
ncbi:pentatricopeptide repeat-containing protein At2g13600-like [Coffea arabica]|uniref:Pentatricopeptide repeat-containing protein At2g13600-like n=1 Tax=Coffea arabica TaxID=13443 RepID=A0ABM4UXJ9_COFAR